MSIQNIHIELLESSYDQTEFGSSFNEIDAIFSTDRTDFGGYSHFFSLEIIKANYKIDLNEIHIVRLHQAKLSFQNLPLLVHTPIIKKDIEDAEKLMDEILEFAYKNSFKKILLTQFIGLKSKINTSVFTGIKQSIKKLNLLSHDITIVIAIDKRQIESVRNLFYDTV